MGLTTAASGEVACSEARFAPRGKATNKVSAAIPPDQRSARRNNANKPPRPRGRLYWPGSMLLGVRPRHDLLPNHSPV